MEERYKLLCHAKESSSSSSSSQSEQGPRRRLYCAATCTGEEGKLETGAREREKNATTTLLSD